MYIWADPEIYCFYSYRRDSYKFFERCISKNSEIRFLKVWETRKKFGPVMIQLGTHISRNSMYFKWAKIRHISKMYEKVSFKIHSIFKKVCAELNQDRAKFCPCFWGFQENKFTVLIKTTFKKIFGISSRSKGNKFRNQLIYINLWNLFQFN